VIDSHLKLHNSAVFEGIIEEIIAQSRSVFEWIYFYERWKRKKYKSFKIHKLHKTISHNNPY